MDEAASGQVSSKVTASALKEVTALRDTSPSGICGGCPVSFAGALPPIIAVQGALLMLLALSLNYAGAQIRYITKLVIWPNSVFHFSGSGSYRFQKTK